MMEVDFQAGARAVNEPDPAPFEGDQDVTWPSIWAGDTGLPNPVETDRDMDNGHFAISEYPKYDLLPFYQGIEPHVHKIAVLRSNAIGDFIFALPALQALRLAYPQAEIVLLGLQWHADFLEGRPGPLDRVIVVPRSRGVREPADYPEDAAEMDRFFDAMVQEHFDLAIQMHGGGRYSNPFVRRLGARLTVGFRAPDSPPLDRWVPYTFYQSEILRYLEVVSLVGARLTSLEPRIFVTARDLEEAEQLVPHSSRPLVVLTPGAGDTRRRWPAEKFAAVGNSLAWMGAQVVVIGTQAEVELAEQVISQMSAEALNLAGRTTLNGLTGLLSRASLVISNDSGPLHLAAAVGAPTVGIYWCGNLITAGPITRTLHRPAISWQLNCSVCGLDCTRYSCDHRESFVAGVTQEEVAASALELLNQAYRPAREPIVAAL